MRDNAIPLILLTRPQAAALRFGAACTACFGAAALVRIAPLQRIDPIGEVPDLTGMGAVIFTSENAVSRVAARTDGGDLAAFCVGDRTAAAARAAGFAAHSASGAAEDLIALIRALPPQGPILHLHGQHQRGDIVARLRALGLDARGLVIYDQRPCPPPPGFSEALAHQGPVIAPQFSARSAGLFASALGLARPAGLVLPCLSPAVRAALPGELQQRASVAPEPVATAMLAAIARHLSRSARLEGSDPLV